MNTPSIYHSFLKGCTVHENLFYCKLTCSANLTEENIFHGKYGHPNNAQVPRQVL